MRCREQLARGLLAVLEASRSNQSFPGLWYTQIGAQNFATIPSVFNDAADTRKGKRREAYRKMEPEPPDLVSP